jgi:hypothetical protein
MRWGRPDEVWQKNKLSGSVGKGRYEDRSFIRLHKEIAHIRNITTERFAFTA